MINMVSEQKKSPFFILKSHLYKSWMKYLMLPHGSYIKYLTNDLTVENWNLTVN